MNKKQNTIQKIYGWIGFTVFWSLSIFLIWSVFENDKALELLVKIFN